MGPSAHRQGGSVLSQGAGLRCSAFFPGTQTFHPTFCCLLSKPVTGTGAPPLSCVDALQRGDTAPHSSRGSGATCVAQRGGGICPPGHSAALCPAQFPAASRPRRCAGCSLGSRRRPSHPALLGGRLANDAVRESPSGRFEAQFSRGLRAVGFGKPPPGPHQEGHERNVTRGKKAATALSYSSPRGLWVCRQLGLPGVGSAPFSGRATP